MTTATSTGESTDLRIVQGNAAFSLLYPSHLPEGTTIASGRWWDDGQVVELHLRSDDPGLPMRGPLTLKEWTGAGVSAPGAGKPGRNADARVRNAGGSPWFVYTSGELCMVEGAIRGINLQLCSLFPEEETLKIAASLGA